MKLTLVDLETGETEDVIAGLVIARRWESENGVGVDEALKTRRLDVMVDFARMAFVRKHGQPITAEEFEDRFEVGTSDRKGTPPPPPPSGPAAVPTRG